MCGDDEQESAGSDLGGPGDCEAVVAQLFASLQSEEVYATSALCLPRAEELFEDGLSRHRRASDGLPITRPGIRAERSSALHDAAKSGGATLGQYAGQAALGCDRA